MNHESQPDETTDLPTKVFREFLVRLGDAGVAPELLERLTKTLIDDKNFTERGLRAAVLPEDPLQ